MSSRSLHVKLADGRSVHLKEWGHGQRVCLLIHGFGEGGYVWNEFAPSVALYYRTFAIDLRGHGDSDWDHKRNYDVKTHVVDVIKVIQALGWRRIALVGHSMGGDIAIRVATECRECILGLVVVDFGPGLNDEGVQRNREEFRAGDKIYQSVAEYAMWLSSRRPLVSPDLLGRMAPYALRPGADGTFSRKVDPSILRSAGHEPDCRLSESDLWAHFKAMTWPVLVVRGQGSALLARDVAERMVNVLPNGHFRSVPFAGHDIMCDNPTGFADAVIPFLLTL
jgi:pimeloyl-ACP methyl ester carboxylesterase